MKIFLTIVLLLLIITFFYGCLPESKETEKVIKHDNKLKKQDIKYFISEPTAVLITHIGVERKPIWPLIWYIDDESFQEIKGILPSNLDIHFIKKEQINVHLLNDFLLHIKNNTVSFDDKLLGSQGISKILFFQRGIGFESYIIAGKELNNVFQQIAEYVDEDSYFLIYLTRMTQ